MKYYGILAKKSLSLPDQDTRSSNYSSKMHLARLNTNSLLLLLAQPRQLYWQYDEH